jgi:Tol biopolymer transport system component
MLKSDGLRRVTTIAAGLLLAAALAVVVLWGARPAEAAFPGANGKIAFTSWVSSRWDRSQYEIFKMNPDGSNVTWLTHNNWNDEEPAWSPDDQRIAVMRNAEIWVMNKDGSGQKRLTYNKRDDYWPDWQPIVP